MDWSHIAHLIHRKDPVPLAHRPTLRAMTHTGGGEISAMKTELVAAQLIGIAVLHCGRE